uniref:CD226 molecule n=1 Tax=Mastacembelus armatus TaxID=205130 RepID=A0A3Q3NE32_9TELE
MEAVQKDHWYFVVLIFLPFLKVAVQQKEPVIVHLEEGMVLNCLCPWEGNLSMVSWTKIPDKYPVAVFHPEYGMAFSHHYRERIEFLRTTPLDGSISMRNVTHQDIGLYHCSVQTFPQGPWTRTIQVEDLEEDDSTEPPTPEVIITNTELVAEQNNNLTINCNHQHNGTVYQAVLQKMPHGQLWDLIGVCKNVDGGLVGEDYSNRGQVICADSLDVTLHLTHVIQEDAGFYRCIFSTDVGEQTVTVLLTVLVPAAALSHNTLTCHMSLVLPQILTHCITYSQPNLYENMPVCPRITKKARQIRNVPVYANLHTVRSHKDRRQPLEK